LKYGVSTTPAPHGEHNDNGKIISDACLLKVVILIARKNIFAYFIIGLMLAYPASAAGETSLNKWVLNVTLQDDGSVEEIIQAEIENGAASSVNGISFVVPSSDVILTSDQIISIPSLGGQVVEQKTTTDGTKITITFNNPLETGKKWNSRITLSTTKWAVKDGMNYSINIPVKAPQIIVGGKENKISVPTGAEIRMQVFFPKAIEIKSIIQTPMQRPYKKLFQFNHEVITWFTDNLQIDDTIKIQGAFSEVLNKIVETNERSTALSASIKKAKGLGTDVTDAEARFKIAEEYLNTALGSFWKGDSNNALQYIEYANDELKLAESSLSAPVKTAEQTPISTKTTEPKKNPGFEALGAIIAFVLIFVLRKK
jgi:hypothetical protein